MKRYIFASSNVITIQCEVLKLADMPSCLGGGEHAINLRCIWIGYNSIRIHPKAKRSVEVRILLSQLF